MRDLVRSYIAGALLVLTYVEHDLLRESKLLERSKELDDAVPFLDRLVVEGSSGGEPPLQARYLVVRPYERPRFLLLLRRVWGFDGNLDRFIFASAQQPLELMVGSFILLSHESVHLDGVADCCKKKEECRGLGEGEVQ